MANILTWKIVDEIASDLGATEAARLKWRQPNRGVPSDWRGRIGDALRDRGWDLKFTDFDDLPANPGRIAA
jgi:hypothetical protein